nr:hypothetical protein CFP56_06515 [Quercus suber]
MKIEDKGRAIAALSKKIHAPSGVVEAEAKAFQMGLQFAKDVGIRGLTHEGDSRVVCHAILDLASPPPSVDAVIISVQKACLDFHHVGFSHVSRQENRPTYLLTKFYKGIDDFCCV